MNEDLPESVLIAIEYLSGASELIAQAEFLIRENAFLIVQNKPDPTVEARKILHHADSLGSRKRETRHAQHLLRRHFGIKSNCECGILSGCEVEGH